MTGENEIGGDGTPLTEAQLTEMERDFPEAVARYRERQAGGDQLKHEPRAQDNASAKPGSETAEQAKAQLSQWRSDPDHLAKMSGRHGHREQQARMDEVERLAKIASGDTASTDAKQAAADADFVPSSVSEYTGLDTQRGNAWSDESKQELAALKGEMFELGVNPGAARGIFSDYGTFLEMDEEAHFSRVENAVATFKQVNGDKAFEDVQRFVRSLKSENMKTAALVAGMSQLGLKEMARLGRSLVRKSVH